MSKPWNVLFVISDQHLATCLGHEGHPQALTPRLDRLAAEGLRFTRAYAQNPICTPSRVSILSGQYCHNHGYYGLVGPCPEHLPSFMGHFKRHGYRTAGIGKLHLPDDPDFWLRDEIDHFADCYAPRRREQRVSPYFEYLEKLGLRDKEDSIGLPEFAERGIQAHEGRPSMLPYEHSVEGWCVAEAIKFMEQCQTEDKPFCMQVSLPRPHQCYTPSQQFWDMYDEDMALPPTFHQNADHRPPHFQDTVRIYQQKMHGLLEPRGHEQVGRRVWRAYLACVTQVDHSLGLLLDHLEQRGMSDNTLVVYSADHGAYSGTYGIPEKAPGICSEAVCRVPFIWRMPGLTPAGRSCGQLVESIDLAPTIASLCGLPAMDWVDGRDIAALVRGGNEPMHQAAVTENVWSKALRWDQWRFVHYQPEMFDGQDVGELYDLANDPDETRNLYHDPAHAPVVEQGRRLILEWLIRSTRITTLWPPVPPTRVAGRIVYARGRDGNEPNSAGALQRALANQRHYL